MAPRMTRLKNDARHGELWGQDQLMNLICHATRLPRVVVTAISIHGWYSKQCHVQFLVKRKQAILPPCLETYYIVYYKHKENL